MGIQIDGPGRVVLTTASGQQLLVELEPGRWCEHASGLQHGAQLSGVRAGLWALRDGRFELVVDVREPAHRARPAIAEVATLLASGPGWCWARSKVGEAVLGLLEDGTVSMRRARDVLAEVGLCSRRRARTVQAVRREPRRSLVASVLQDAASRQGLGWRR